MIFAENMIFVESGKGVVSTPFARVDGGSNDGNILLYNYLVFFNVTSDVNLF